MTNKDSSDLSKCSMAELFRMEVEVQSAIITEGLLALEHGSSETAKLQDLMRATHSLKGAARIVGRNAAVQVAHAMEDCIVAAQNSGLILSAKHIDTMLRGVDLLVRIAQVSDEQFAAWEARTKSEIDGFLLSLSSPASPDLDALLGQVEARLPITGDTTRPSGSKIIPESSSTAEPSETAARRSAGTSRMLRVNSDNLNRLLGLAGEVLVDSRWLSTFCNEMVRIKKQHQKLLNTLELLSDSLAHVELDKRSVGYLTELRSRATGIQRAVGEDLDAIERFDRRLGSLSTRIYQGVLDCRMRPFLDCAHVFPRMVRDLGNSLGKSVKLEITGESTPVDRDILDKLKAPLDHILRNAVDHAIEAPAERVRLGKHEQGNIQLVARHSAGMLLVTVSDDGYGINGDELRQAVLEKKLAASEMISSMSEAELFEFLFLPGFSLKKAVSVISGRGVGLDVVKNMVKEIGGSVPITSQAGQGTRLQLELPLTLSVMRAILVEVSGEPFALPLARLDKAVALAKEQIQSVEGRQCFALGEQYIGLISASQVLELEESRHGDEVAIIVIGDKTARYGLVVDRFLGEQQLVVRPLDPRLGKVPNISAAALMPNGSPILIIDVDDLLRNIENLTAGHRVSQINRSDSAEIAQTRKRILVIDDSLTVRELERKLLGNRGYIVDVAVDGLDAWNAVRSGNYDLVLTDVDMPRLDGVELLKLIRKDSRLKSLPVMIVSYKDREEDRQRGLEAGADYYLTKGSFHDETLVRAVSDMIGGIN